MIRLKILPKVQRSVVIRLTTANISDEKKKIVIFKKKKKKCTVYYNMCLRFFLDKIMQPDVNQQYL